jgi:hypothetical protein
MSMVLRFNVEVSSNEIALGSLVVAVIALIVAVAGFILRYLDFAERRREREPAVSLEVFQEPLQTPIMSYWTIRVRGNRQLERCRVNFDGTPLETIVGRDELKVEMPLAKGGGLNFRIPSPVSISSKSSIVVLDGDRIVRQTDWGSVPQTVP